MTELIVQFNAVSALCKEMIANGHQGADSLRANSHAATRDRTLISSIRCGIDDLEQSVNSSVLRSAS